MAQPLTEPLVPITHRYVAIPRRTNNYGVSSASSSSLPIQTVAKTASAATEPARWEAVRTRNPSFNNPFVYAVRSTRIYCKPSCPARLARKANIEYYDTPAAAAAAGYRACKRCKPDSIGTVMTTSTTKDGKIVEIPRGQAEKVAKACEAITFSVLGYNLGHDGQHNQLEQQCRRPPGLRQLAAEAGLTPFHFHRVFKKVVGKTPGQYARDVAATKMEDMVTANNHHPAIHHVWSPASIIDGGGLSSVTSSLETDQESQGDIQSQIRDDFCV